MKTINTINKSNVTPLLKKLFPEESTSEGLLINNFNYETLKQNPYESRYLGKITNINHNYRYDGYYIAPQWVRLVGGEGIPSVTNGYYRSPAFYVYTKLRINRNSNKYIVDTPYDFRFYPIGEVTKDNFKTFSEVLDNERGAYELYSVGDLLINNTWNYAGWCFGSLKLQNILDSLHYMESGLLTADAVKTVIIQFLRSRPNNDLQFDDYDARRRLQSLNLFSVPNGINKKNAFYNSQKGYLDENCKDITNINEPTVELANALDKFWFSYLSRIPIERVTIDDRTNYPKQYVPESKHDKLIKIYTKDQFKENMSEVIEKINTYNIISKHSRVEITLDSGSGLTIRHESNDIDQIYEFLIEALETASTNTDDLSNYEYTVDFEHPYLAIDALILIKITIK